MPAPAISLIVPVYNEEKLIYRALLCGEEIMSSSGVEYEIVVVDDGSTDASAEIIDKNFSGRPNFIIYHKITNGGIGSALSKGIELAGKSHILFMPVDSPLNKTLFNQFVSNINKADLLVGYRTSRKGYNMRMKFNSWFYHLLISRLFNINLVDYNWIHLYPRKLFDSGVQIEFKGIFMLAEVLIKAKWMGFSIFEFEVEQEERITGDATAASYKAALETLRDTLAFYYSYVIRNEKKKLLKAKIKSSGMKIPAG